MSLNSASSIVTEIQGIADTILSTIGAVAPGVALETTAAAGLVDLFSTLATKALAAYSEASGTPINTSTVAGLLPNPTPLTPPNPE